MDKISPKLASFIATTLPAADTMEHIGIKRAALADMIDDIRATAEERENPADRLVYSLLDDSLRMLDRLTRV